MCKHEGISIICHGKKSEDDIKPCITVALIATRKQRTAGRQEVDAGKQEHTRRGQLQAQEDKSRTRPGHSVQGRPATMASSVFPKREHEKPNSKRFLLLLLFGDI